MIAKEGQKIILVVTGIVFVILIIGGIFGISILKYLGGISIGFVFFLCYFFRDPKRIIPEGENIILSPADGKVIVNDEIETVEGRRKMVSVFLSLFDVHSNRVPVDGIVTKVVHKKGKFFVAHHHKASEINEQTEIYIHTGERLVKIRQVAGFLARRILCYLKQGDHVSRGAKLGFIRFGSRNDLILPLTAEIWVTVGERVKGGETVIGVLK